MTMIALPLWWVANERQKVRNRKEAVEAMEAISEVGVTNVYYENKPPTPAWRRILLGDDSDVEVVALQITGATDEHLAHISCLPSITELDLFESTITDDGLAHLTGMKNLKSLDFGGAQITDAGLVHVATLTNLERFWFAGTQVTDTGLMHLAKLKKLENISTYGTAVTEEGLKELKKSLPKVRQGPFAS